MQKRTRFNLIFVALCAGIFALACIAITQFMIRLIWWYMGNCNSASSLCSRVGWFISNWWLFFVPLTLLMALLANRLYIKLCPRDYP